MTETETGDGNRPAATPEELIARLRVLTRGVQDLLAARARELGLGTSDFLALIRASNGDGVTGAQLAQAFAMRSSSVTGLADRLQAKGLIVRRPHPTDRRTVLLHATRRGQATVTRTIGPLLQQLHRVAGELENDDRTMLAAFLDGIAAALSEATTHPASPTPSRRRSR